MYYRTELEVHINKGEKFLIKENCSGRHKKYEFRIHLVKYGWRLLGLFISLFTYKICMFNKITLFPNIRGTL